jgi:hypothetical protein
VISVTETNKNNGAVLEAASPDALTAAGEKRSKRGRKPAAERGSGTMRVRYFLLGKDSARENGRLVLGEEFENEDKSAGSFTRRRRSLSQGGDVDGHAAEERQRHGD